MGKINIRAVRTAAVVTVASAAAVAGLIGVAGAVGSRSSAKPDAAGYGYGYCNGVYGYGYNCAATPTPSATTAAPTPSASATTTPPPTINPSLVKLTLTRKGSDHVKLGTKVTLSGTVTYNGAAVPGANVVLTEKYSDGKLVPLGQFTTNASGAWSHVDTPLYIGNITAHLTLPGYATFNSNTVPIRVLIGFRRTTITKTSTGLITVKTSTHPGFITGPNRQERVQLLLTDSHGNQKEVLALVNAAKRTSAPSEGQGVNTITFKNIDLGHGTFYVKAKVLGTPVNSGNSTQVFKVTL